jgi:hypothetical protein
MTVPNGVTLPLQRLNTFQGMMIDAAAWRDEHSYHREQGKLERLALHGWGIVSGLNLAVEGDDSRIIVEAGTAIDPSGNLIVVPDPHTLRITSERKGEVHILLQVREILAGPTQVGPDGAAQPTRVFESYRIQAHWELPDEPFVELARVQYDPGNGRIRVATNPEEPRENDLDLRNRVNVQQPSAVEGVGGVQQVAAAIQLSRAKPDLVAAGWDKHRPGLQLLAREIEASNGRPVHILEGTAAIADQLDLLYITGHATLELSEAEVAGITRTLDQGGLVVGEGCQAGPGGAAGAREFAVSFLALADQVERKLGKVGRGHTLLASRYVFSQPPTGARKSTRVLEDRGMVYCDADYGCAWEGGAPDAPLARWAIRDAHEFGVNLALHRQSAR